VATKKLTGEEKSAILLLSMGEDAAAEVMKHLEPKEIRRLGGPLTELSDVTHEVRNEVVAEFKSLAASGEMSVEAKGYMKKILTKALGKDKAAQIIASLAAPEFNGLESLKWLDAKALARLVTVEHPQTAAVILAHLEPELASQALSLLPESMRLDVAHRLATIEEIPQDVLKDLSEVLEAELKVGLKSQAQQLGGIKFLADILNGMDKGVGNALTAGLAERNETLAESVKQLMFVFDDLAGVDDRGIQELLKEVAKEDLTLALRAAGESVKEAVFRNMSSRAVELLKDDMDAGGPVKLTEVEKAQRNILQVARKLEEEGRIVLGGKGGEEMV
jgi:flagellar motor switch protein FliG